MSAPLSAAVSEPRLVRITQLSVGYTPRQLPLDEEHVNSLVEATDQVPPIIIDECTMTVIDGVTVPKQRDERGEKNSARSCSPAAR